MNLIKVIAALLIGISVPVLAQSPSWRPDYIDSYITPSRHNMNGISASNHYSYSFIAVGDSGVIMINWYGNDWKTSEKRPTTAALYGVAKSDSLLVIVGSKGTILTSKNDFTWAKRNSNTTNDLLSVAWNVNLFVAVGKKGTLLTSPDGIVWKIRSLPFKTNINCVTPVHLGTNRFAAVGDSGMILTSIDGINWKSHSRDHAINLYGVTASQPFNPANYPFKVTIDSSIYAVGDSGTILKSMDGSTWNKATSITSKTLRSVAIGYSGIIILYKRAANTPPWGNAVVLAVGDSGITIGAFGSWGNPNPRIINAQTTNNFSAIAPNYTPSEFSAIGDSGLARSISFCFYLDTKKNNQNSESTQRLYVKGHSIHYSIGQPQHVSIDLYNIKGALIKSLVTARLQPGSYVVSIPDDIAPGPYILRCNTGSPSMTRINIF